MHITSSSAFSVPKRPLYEAHTRHAICIGCVLVSVNWYTSHILPSEVYDGLGSSNPTCMVAGNLPSTEGVLQFLLYDNFSWDFRYEVDIACDTIHTCIDLNFFCFFIYVDFYSCLLLYHSRNSHSPTWSGCRSTSLCCSPGHRKVRYEYGLHGIVT